MGEVVVDVIGCGGDVIFIPQQAKSRGKQVVTTCELRGGLDIYEILADARGLRWS
jgi:hypothetical protein